MLILLPPSETKLSGGVAGSRLNLEKLSFAELNPVRLKVISTLETLSANPSEAAQMLKLGPRQAGEIAQNLALRKLETLPALERYTGVLYDALDAKNLPNYALDFARKHLAIASALFGLNLAGDNLPSYRLSANSRLPNLVLRKAWSGAIGGVLARIEGLILDLRSQSYVALGALPAKSDAAYLSVVASTGGRALNHFNKAAKGYFVRQILLAGIDFGNLDELLHWARAEQIPLSLSKTGTLELVAS